MKRAISLLLAVVLLVLQLPTLAEDSLTVLTRQEKAEAQRLIAMEGDAQGWEKGDAFTADMNALQAQQCLDWLLSDEVDSLVNSVLDSRQLLEEARAGEGNLLDGLSTALMQLRNKLAYYRDQLEQERLSVLNDLRSLEEEESATELGQKRAAVRVRASVANIQSIITAMAGYYAQYQDLLKDHHFQLKQVMQTPQSPELVASGEEKLSAEAARLTAEEEKKKIDFEVLVLSTKQFGFVVRDADGKPMEKVKVHVSSSKYENVEGDKFTDKNGQAVFLIKDFRPDDDNRILIDVVFSKDNYCTREMRKLNMRGGLAEHVSLETYAGQPYLRMACYNGHDILSQQDTIFYTLKNDAPQTFSVLVEKQKAKPFSGSLYLGYQVYNADGEVVEKEEKHAFDSGSPVYFTNRYCQQIVPGSTVSIRVESDDFTRTYQTQLKVKKAVVEEPQYSNQKNASFTTGGFKFRFPDSIPFLGGTEMSLDFPGAPAQLMIDPSGYIQFAFGKNFQPEEASWKSESLKDKTQRMDEADREGQRDAHAVENQVYQNQGATKRSKVIGETKGTFTLFGALQGYINDVEERFSIKGVGGVQGAFKGGFGWQFTVGVVPMYAALDYAFSLGVSMGLGLEADYPSLGNMKFLFGDSEGVQISFLAELGASLGVGVRGLASAALRLAGKIASLIRLNTAASAALDLGFALDITAQFVFIKVKQTLWKNMWHYDSRKNANAAQTAGVPSSQTYAFAGEKDGEAVPSSQNGGIASAWDNQTGVFPDEETEVFSWVDTLATSIQYVTLTSGTQTATFGFWIRPIVKTGERIAELVWYNLDSPDIHGTVIFGDDEWRRTGASDYDFAIMGEGDLVGITILSGRFETGKDKPTESRMTLAVMQAKNVNGKLRLEIENAAGIGGAYFTDVYQAIAGESSSRSLSMPMIHFTNSTNGSSNTQWFLNAACNNEMGNGYTAEVVSKDWQRKPDGSLVSNVFIISDKLAGDWLPAASVRLVAAEPNKLTVDGQPIQDRNQSSSCYYRLAMDNSSARVDKLSVRMNETGKVLDQDVVYMEALRNQGANLSQEEIVFYLKKGKADDGSDCYRLMSVQHRLNSGLFQLRDYDVPLYAAHFQTVVVNDGRNGLPYLYWVESVNPGGNGEEEGYGAEARYQVKCVRFDRETNTMTAPFTLVELSQMPSSLHLLMDGTGYYTVELEQENESAVVRQKLIRFQFSLQTAVALKGVVASDPCVCRGEYGNLLFSVENTGNLPVSRFTVAITQQGKTEPLQTITVDCRNPQNASVNNLFGDSNASAYSVGRVDSLYDNMNGDHWLLTSYDPGGGQTVEQVRTDLLMPGGVHTYQAAFKVPDDWEGTVKLSAELVNVFALTRYTLSDGDRMTNDSEEEVGFNSVGQRIDRGGAVLPAADVETSGQIGVRLGSVRQTSDKDKALKKGIDLGQGDLMLDCQPYVDTKGMEYVRVNIAGRSQTAVETQPTLTAMLSGKQVFQHTFQAAIDEDFSYTLNLPASRLLNGLPAGEVTFTLTDNLPEEAAEKEFADFDNQRTVLLGSVLTIVKHPASQTASAGDHLVFSVTATGGTLPYRYQWQRQNADGSWTNISGANQADYTLTVSARENGARLRCVVKDESGQTAVSETAVITLLSAMPPATGDAAQPALWALAALLCMALLLIGWRRRNA